MRLYLPLVFSLLLVSSPVRGQELQRLREEQTRLRERLRERVELALLVELLDR